MFIINSDGAVAPEPTSTPGLNSSDVADGTRAAKNVFRTNSKKRCVPDSDDARATDTDLEPTAKRQKIDPLTLGPLEDDWSNSLKISEHLVVQRGGRFTQLATTRTWRNDGGLVIVKQSARRSTRATERELVNSVGFLGPELSEMSATDLGEMDENKALFHRDATSKARRPFVASFSPITTIQCPVSLLRAYIDCISIHKVLSSLQISHRHISLDTLMYRNQRGIVIDFDLENYYHPGRIGLLPFIARELLREGLPLYHLPRYDLESFYYVILYHTSRFQPDEYLGEMEQIDLGPFSLWLNKCTQEGFDRDKERFWSSETQNYLGVGALATNCMRGAPHFDEVFAKPMQEIREVIREGMVALRGFIMKMCYARFGRQTFSERFDVKTMDGRVTHDKVLQILRKAEEELGGSNRDMSAYNDLGNRYGDMSWEKLDEENEKLVEEIFQAKRRGY